MTITENYLFLRNHYEFTDRVLRRCYQRLQMQLCVCFNEIKPHAIFTNDLNILETHYGEGFDPNKQRAFYNEDESTCIFHCDNYVITDEIKEQYIGYKIKNIKYAIPIGDIYHELIHHIQYNYTEWKYTNYIEAIAEIYTSIITGIYQIDYVKESIALWNISKNILQLKPEEFYLFIRDSIVDSNFVIISGKVKLSSFKYLSIFLSILALIVSIVI